jgi:hypothetical protein
MVKNDELEWMWKDAVMEYFIHTMPPFFWGVGVGGGTNREKSQDN